MLPRVELSQGIPNDEGPEEQQREISGRQRETYAVATLETAHA